MPLEIATRILKSHEIKSRSNGVFLVYFPYVPIFQLGYGRMDPSTPGKGLSTAGVASCTVVVLHCPSTHRTVVTHSPNLLYMSTFVPMIDYITGGQGDQTSFQDRRRWEIGMTGNKKPVDIEAVVIRGSWYADPAQARLYGHEGWMSDFRELFDRISFTRSINANIVDFPRFLLSGTVLVDKATARITYISIPTGGQNTSFVKVEFIHHPSYTPEQRHQDVFVSNVQGVQGKCQDIHLQWDIDHYCPSIPLTGITRELLRSKFLGEPEEKQCALLRAAGIQDFISNSPSENLSIGNNLNRIWERYNLIKPPCERCGEIGASKCASCRGAWYCSKLHQTEHWKTHKAWCKDHKLTT